MRKGAMSLRLRLTLMMGGLFLVAIVALYSAARSYALVAADRSYDRLLTGSALSIVESMSVADGRILVDIPYAALDMLSAAPEDRVFYSVIGPDLQTVTGYDDLPRRLPRLRSDTDPNLPLTRFFDAPYRGETVRFVLLGREIARPGSTGLVWVQVGQTRRAREELQRDLVLRAVTPILIFALLALAMVWIGIKGALRPLRAIGDELARREPSNLQSIETSVPEEMEPVIRSLNGFIRRLQGNLDRLRSFIADAAHQMRTPLAALLAQAQLASGGDKEELSEAIAKIERNASKLTRLINQLLSDATVHHRSDIRRFDDFDLVGVIRHAITETLPRAGESDLRFTTRVSSAIIYGDSVILGEAVKNLIDNALRHGGGRESEVSIEFAKVDASYVLTVEDRGPGIKQEDRHRVFERFARGTSPAPGAGLGLSIVRQAVEAHDGSVTLMDRQGGGLRVLVRLPEKEA